MKKSTVVTLFISIIVFSITFINAYNWSRQTFKFEVKEDPYQYIKAYYTK